MRDDFQISGPELDTAVEALLASGALGARLTGGGFGGCVIGLLPQSSVENARDAVQAAFFDSGYAAPTDFRAEPSGGAYRVNS